MLTSKSNTLEDERQETGEQSGSKPSTMHIQEDLEEQQEDEESEEENAGITIEDMSDQEEQYQ